MECQLTELYSQLTACFNVNHFWEWTSKSTVVLFFLYTKRTTCPRSLAKLSLWELNSISHFCLIVYFCFLSFSKASRAREPIFIKSRLCHTQLVKALAEMMTRQQLLTFYHCDPCLAKKGALRNDVLTNP